MDDDRGTGRMISASVVVVSYNTAEHIEACLLSLLELDYSPGIEVIVVDNASTDGSAELIRERFPGVELVELPHNKGFAGGASVGLYMASGEIVATVNPDVRLDPRWMRVVSETLQSPNAGIVGSKILYPDGRTIQHAGGVVHYPLATTEHLGRGEEESDAHNHQKVVSFVTGAALAMRRDVGRTLKFFDEEYYPLYYEDVDLCWRATAEGLRTIYQPKAVAYHKESVTMDRRGSLYYSYYHANRLRFVVKRYTPEQIMLDFLPAEAARVTAHMPRADKQASVALLDNRLGNGSHRPSEEESHVAIARRWDDLNRHITEVMKGWQVYERAYAGRNTSARKGAFGRLRNLLDRLYTWPLHRKQIEQNASVARAVREISSQLADLQARVALQALLSSGLASREASGVNDVAAELEALRGRVEQLESAKRGFGNPVAY
jgi:GT2 family glycosyltransferase